MSNDLQFVTMEASYCLCGQPYDPNIFMIQCDICRDWFHGSCCNFQEHTASEIDKYHCPRCSPMYGPSQYKPYRNFHRHDYWDGDAVGKLVQTGTAVFIRELKTRHFNSEGDVVLHMRGEQLTEAHLTQTGFENPIVVDTQDGLEITLPTENFSIYDVEAFVGGEFEMDVIDVTRQRDLKMSLGDFVAYFTGANRTQIFNVVSLEFSKTGLARMVDAPLIARTLDWANCLWPKDYPIEKPNVQKYCLMSVKDSYTDFHIDFGGTSVWYHVMKGEKIFYLIKPTPANLCLYQQWMTSSNQSETFFADQVDQCFKCVLRKGQTMFIPTGWIHAVLTPVDSLVFGGNFLHRFNIPMQLRVYDIEKKIKTATKYLYPHFETIHWFAAQRMLAEITQINQDEGKCPSPLLVGLKAIVVYLKQWNTEKDYYMLSREQIPLGLNVTKFFKDISKEVRHAERYLNTLNPPKPERESKRKRKKPVNKDFVDYSMSKPNLEFLTAENLGIKKTPHKAVSPLKLTLPKPATYPYNRHAIVSPSAVMDSNWNTDIKTEATAVHRGGAVLKIKLGSKDIIPVDPIKLEDELMLPDMTRSIYDFHDDSEREEDCFDLSIDESVKRKKVKFEPGAGVKTTNVYKQFDDTPCSLSAWQTKEEADMAALESWGMSIKTPEQEVWDMKVETDVDVETELPKNGIESLLKASALTNKFLNSSESDGRASPSTQEAIAGMLSISQTYIQPGKSTKKRYRPSTEFHSDDDMTNVHQDEDYIYPALDNSDDDDEIVFKPRGRSTVDEPWNPKARVGPLLPKMNRPAREGTKKQAIEKVLEAAAKRVPIDPNDKSLKRLHRKKKMKMKAEKKRMVPCTSATLPAPSLPAIITTPTTASTATSTSTPSKPRKGMKTVKQRLGKILKIHKMMH